MRDFQLGSEARLQFRVEVFNVANHANFGLPVADLNSVNFGRIFSAGAAAADAVRAEADFLGGRRKPEAAHGTMTNGSATRLARRRRRPGCSSASRRSSSTRFGVFLKPLTAEFGWSREAVSAALRHRGDDGRRSARRRSATCSIASRAAADHPPVPARCSAPRSRRCPS